MNAAGGAIYKQKLTHKKLKEKIVNLPTCTVAMEACGSAHYWGRLFRSYGHEVKLIAPEFVKPYVKSNKTDAADAEAIGEAAQRPTMRFVALKEVEQQDVQSLHCMRSMVVTQKTALITQIRGLLQEYGVGIPKGSAKVFEKLPLILEDAENELSDYFRTLLSGLYDALKDMEKRLKDDDQQMLQMSQQHEEAKRLQTIPGIGPIIATA